MMDLFHFLKEFLQSSAELIAAFLVGVFAALMFIAPLLYKIIGWGYVTRMTELEARVKDAKEELQEAQGELESTRKKSKERKDKLQEQTTQLHQLSARLDAAEQARTQLQSAHDELKAQNRTLLGKNQRLAKNAEAKLKASITQGTALKKQVQQLLDDVKLIEKVQGELWDAPAEPTQTPPFRPLRKKGAPIIAVTNLKGGVGKTTLTANIAVTYAHQKNLRVLVIDLDFQASLTHLCLSTERVSALGLGNGKLIDGAFLDLSAGIARHVFDRIVETQTPNLRLLATSENLANVEERAKARWLMHRDAIDVRCVLRSALHDPQFQESFDLILIDCPPRWTTSSINAIACCDYVLIPTQLDRVSAEAVPRLLAWLKTLRGSSAELYGNFQVLGVIGNLAFNREGLIAQERTIWEASPDKCARAWIAPVHHFGTIIKDKSEVRRAANHREFAALLPTLQPTFLTLIDEIEARRSSHEGR